MNDNEFSIDSLWSEVPLGLSPLTDMNRVNQPIPVFSGIFILEANEERYECEGKIEYVWLPSPTIRLEGHAKLSQEFVKKMNQSVIFDLLVEGGRVGSVLLTGFTTSSLDSVWINGQLSDQYIIGDTDVEVDTIRFDIPNLRYFLGDSIRHNTSVSKSRLVFACDDYSIVLDQVLGFRDRYSELEKEGGYVITYTGSLTRLTGKISYEEAEHLLERIRYFLSFVNGTFITPIKIVGFCGNASQWEMYNTEHYGMYKHSWTWAKKFETASICRLWKPFTTCLQEEGSDWLTSTLHWYLSANQKQGYAEGSIILIQSALELLYNRLCVEIPYDPGATLLSDHAPASRKISCLLTMFHISLDIPSGLRHTIAFAEGKNGPTILTEIRNAIVHGKESNRKKLLSVPGLVRAEVLNLGTYYVEQILLKYLGFEGSSFNRCNGMKYV